MGGHDEGDQEGGTRGATVGTCEQPRFPSQRKTSQRPLGGIVCQADPAVLGEAGEVAPTLEQVVDRPGDGGRARELGPLLAQPCFQFGEQRRAPFLAHGQALAGAEPVDGALDRSEEHTSELQSLMRISYAVFCLKKKKKTKTRLKKH